MGIWNSNPKLEPGESLKHQFLANSFRGRRSIGGRITITESRFIFVPNRLDAATGGRRIDVRRSEIIGVRLTPSGRAGTKKYGIAASLRNPVEILTAGAVYAVTVSDPEQLRVILSGE